MKIIGLIENKYDDIYMGLKNIISYCDAICIASDDIINIDLLIPVKIVSIKFNYTNDLIEFSNYLSKEFNFTDIYGFLNTNLKLVNKNYIDPFLFKIKTDITNFNMNLSLEDNCRNAIKEKDYYKALYFYNLSIQNNSNNNLVAAYCIIHYHIFNKNKTDGLKFALNNNLDLFKLFIQNIGEITNIIEIKPLPISSFKINENEYMPSSSSILKYKDGYLINVRCTNYKLIQGRYNTPNNIINTLNCLMYTDNNLNIKSDISIFKNVNNINRKSSVLGFEDLRLFEYNDKIYFIATQMEYSQNMLNQMVVGEYDIENKTYLNFNIIKSPFNKDCEKNWLPVVINKELNFIYNWYPLQIGKINENNELVIIKTYNTPLFFNQLRGSVAPIYDEINKVYYVLTHGVLFPDSNISNRQYYHVLITLDENLKPLKYSPPFYFKKFNIEYCIGMTINENKFSFIFSQHDKDPMIITVWGHLLI
jgi:hypothetical protein